METNRKGNSFFTYSFISVFQISMPTFPVVVKIGHAHSGMGKVGHVYPKQKLLSSILKCIACNINARILVWHGKRKIWYIWLAYAFTLKLEMKQ